MARICLLGVFFDAARSSVMGVWLVAARFCGVGVKLFTARYTSSGVWFAMARMVAARGRRVWVSHLIGALTGAGYLDLDGARRGHGLLVLQGAHLLWVSSFDWRAEERRMSRS